MSQHTDELEGLMKQYVELHNQWIACADGALRYQQQSVKAKEEADEIQKKMDATGKALKEKLRGE